MEYFKQHNFDIKDNERMIDAFKRLSIKKRWNQEYLKKEKINFINIINTNLNERYNNLEHYQVLCIKLFNIKPITITQCKKELKKVYINIWDIIDENYTYFTDYKEFKKYTLNCKVYPRKEAKKLNLNVFLKQL